MFYELFRLQKQGRSRT
uniref:Uncharacterized protein n=1 Tax=Arundo donax TaxID=35708 RepID=A0A0A9AXY4_ARUDO